MICGLCPAHLGGLRGMLGIVHIDNVGVHLDLLAVQDVPHPAGQVLVGVRDVVKHHADWPGITIERRCAPVIIGTLLHESEQPLSCRIDLRGVLRRAPLVGHALSVGGNASERKQIGGADDQ